MKSPTVAQLVWTVAVLRGIDASTNHLPVVDLGYERHQAISFNETNGLYNFSNIRYAEPPLGELRFNAPMPVSGNSSVVNNGSVGFICPQARPSWQGIASEFIPDYLQGIEFNVSAISPPISPPAVDPRTTEDCLFLDVVIPEKVLEKANRSSYSGAPVIVWNYGGGFVSGDKSKQDPAGLIASSQVQGSDGAIYVAFNYRLGAFGFLAGPSLQSNGTANAALLDQRLVFEWVQKYIHLFGGDPTRVTALGESGGAGLIMHQITAYGGLKGRAPFHQAVLQSPVFTTTPGSYAPELATQQFLMMLNVSTIDQARKLPSERLIAANAAQINAAPYASFIYGPVVDGSFTPALPGRLLLQGSFDKDVEVMVGHNADEGLIFTPPGISNDTSFDGVVMALFPDAQPSIVTYITTVLYPPIFNGSKTYKDQTSRLAALLSDWAVQCNTRYVEKAFGNNLYAYLFSSGFALHAEDLPYTFYNGPNPAVLNATVALALQRYITSFVESGIPSASGFPVFDKYRNEMDVVDFGTSGVNMVMDNLPSAKCDWWQKALYY